VRTLFDKIKNFLAVGLTAFVILFCAQTVFQSSLRAMEEIEEEGEELSDSLEEEHCSSSSEEEDIYEEKTAAPFAEGSPEQNRLKAFSSEILRLFDSFPIPNDHTPEEQKKIFNTDNLLIRCMNELNHKIYQQNNIPIKTIKNKVLEKMFFILKFYFQCSTTNKKSYKNTYNIELFAQNQKDPISQLFTFALKNNDNDNETKQNTQKFLNQLNDEFLKYIDLETYISKLEQTLNKPELVTAIDIHIYEKKLNNLMEKIKSNNDYNQYSYIKRLKQLYNNYINKTMKYVDQKFFVNVEKKLNQLGERLNKHINKDKDSEKEKKQLRKKIIIIGIICVYYLLLDFFVAVPLENHCPECV
jgi:hypothetical protein